MLSPTPPLSRIVIVFPSYVTTQDSSLLLLATQSKLVIATETVLQLSVAVAVKETGERGGVMLAGALHCGLPP